MSLLEFKHKSCSFFGHRNIDATPELKQKIKEIIEDLISNHNVTTFLFGSRSDFNYLCHFIVTELKEKYKHIKRIAYTGKSECCILEDKKQKWEEIYLKVLKQKVNLLCVEEEFEHKAKFIAGKASYIERNKAMIDNSDYCIFYFNKHCQYKSGTAIAYAYAKQKKKCIINVFT